MADALNSLTARRTRNALKNLTDKNFSDTPKETIVDEVVIASPLSGKGVDDPYYLQFRRNDEVIASYPVSKGTLRRLSHEMQWFKDLRSGSRLAFRHGNKP